MIGGPRPVRRSTRSHTLWRPFAVFGVIIIAVVTVFALFAVFTVLAIDRPCQLGHGRPVDRTHTLGKVCQESGHALVSLDFIESPDSLGSGEKSRLGADISLNDVCCMLKSTSGLAMIDQFLHLRQALSTTAVTDPNGFKCAVETVERVARSRPIGGIRGSTESPNRQYHSGCNRNRPSSEPVHQRWSGCSSDRRFGDVSEVGCVGFAAEF